MPSLKSPIEPAQHTHNEIRRSMTRDEADEWVVEYELSDPVPSEWLDGFESDACSILEFAGISCEAVHDFEVSMAPDVRSADPVSVGHIRARIHRAADHWAPRIVAGLDRALELWGLGSVRPADIAQRGSFVTVPGSSRSLR